MAAKLGAARPRKRERFEMQATDFATTDGGFTAIDPPVFFSLPPMMTVGGLVLLALAVLIGWWIGSEQGRSNTPDPTKAAREIYDAVLKASTAAVSASNDDLKSRTIALQKVLDDLLGPVLKLGKGLSGATKGVDEALKGRIKVEKPADHGAPHSPAHTPGHGDAGHEPHAHPAPAAVSSVTVIGLPIGSMVTTPPAPAHAHGQGHGHGDQREETRDMTADEQVEALARAVRAFHNYWIQDGRKAELTAARAALGKRPPAHLLPGDRRADATDRQGWRFGD
ncbi:hypothetical protein [Brevundimonas sp. Leaf363]|uniref:hypothetical protein n=1 Tax=Brevundimonas sp. Leaf363 TaxID=1736353 RepID=UPI000AC684A9|nr:hypothetical protein [Brevundimonas sp. Leaf363]